MKKRHCVLLALALMLCGGALWAEQPERVTFVPMNTITVRPGHPVPAKFIFEIKPGFHINSNKPSMEELIPTVLHFSLPGDVVIGRLQYPAGQLKSFPFDPSQKLSVYSGQVVITARVVAPGSAAVGTYTVHGSFRYQACDDSACFPPKTLPITFNVKVGSGSRGAGHRARPTPTSPHIH